MILMKSFLKWILYGRFKVIYAYLGEGNLVRKCYLYQPQYFRSSRPEVFFGKGVLKICGKSTLLKSHFGMGVLL